MDFEDVDIRDFVSYVSKVTGENFIVGPNVKGRITIVSPNKVPIDEVFSVFLSVLEVHGYTTVKAGAMTKIVPSSGAAGKGIDTNPVNSSPTYDNN
jgi:general secretion pathway protein D